MRARSSTAQAYDLRGAAVEARPASGHLRPKTLRREHVAGYPQARAMASVIVREQMDELRVTVRALADLLGVGKTRVHRITDPREPDAMTLADLLYLADQEGDGEHARTARRMARDIVERLAKVVAGTE